jgi:hypothetical protein
VTLAATGHRMVEWRQEYWREISAFLHELAPPQRRLVGSGIVQK